VKGGLDNYGLFRTCGVCKQKFSGQLLVGVEKMYAEHAYRSKPTHVADIYNRLHADEQMALTKYRQETGQSETTISKLRIILRKKRGIFGQENSHTRNTAVNLAIVLQQAGRFDEAEKIYRETLAAEKIHCGSESDDTLSSAANLGCLLRDSGRYKEACKILRETLVIRRRVFGASHSSTQNCMYNLGLTHEESQNRQAAVPLYRECLQIRHRVFGPQHPDTIRCSNALSRSLISSGQIDEA